eukprot:CAMPEP_0198211714 /NCGR_PEP_ID=MMETSP1445-20131203/25245_1 /TAXON_ID=36898 /ORGANISM="Pyramimonas sp., Strain CCMP2087" /LENGTH=328 /DNA_ID=CAMNT_0043886037 /DNA_START=87 /DNA_END=1073 /DNA_ORIENTATION=+
MTTLTQRVALTQGVRFHADRRCEPRGMRAPPLAARCSGKPVNADSTKRAEASPLELSSASSRRTALGAAAAVLSFPFLAERSQASAEVKTVMVVGATGATGQFIYKELLGRPGVRVIAGVRSLEKAEKMGITGAVKVDVTSSPATIASALVGVDAVVCATGFIPGNPFKFSQAAHAIDNVGTVNLVDAAVSAGVTKFVLISSILTNGRVIGQEKSPGFVITNAFGGVLDEKLVAEQHLRASGMDYTIVRPGGLKGEPAKTPLVVSGEDTLFSGEISRELVGAAAAEAVFAPGAKNKVVELMESGSCVDPGKPGCPTSAGSNDRSTWFA